MGLHWTFIILVLSNAEGVEKTTPVLSGQPSAHLTQQLYVVFQQVPDNEPVNVDSETATAKDEDGQSRNRLRAVYVHAERGQTGEKIGKSLEGYRIDCRLLHVKNLRPEALEDADLIIVGAGTEDSWEAKDAVETIKNSKLPVFAMGEGGYQLFGKLGLRIGAPHGQFRKGTPLKPNAEAIFWDGFRPKLVNGSYDCFSAGDQISIKLEDSFEGVIPIAAEGESDKLFPLILQQPHYLFWGYNGTFGQMTGTGHQLLPWACYYTVAMKRNPDRAFMSKSEVERIKESNR